MCVIRSRGEGSNHFDDDMIAYPWTSWVCFHELCCTLLLSVNNVYVCKRSVLAFDQFTRWWDDQVHNDQMKYYKVIRWSGDQVILTWPWVIPCKTCPLMLSTSSPEVITSQNFNFFVHLTFWKRLLLWSELRSFSQIWSLNFLLLSALIRCVRSGKIRQGVVGTGKWEVGVIGWGP